MMTQSPHTPDNTQDLGDKLTELAIKTVHEILPALVKFSQSSITQFIDSFSRDTDKFIIQTQNNELIDFVAGYATLNYIEGNQMQVVFDFYFQNPQGEWINKKSQTSVLLIDDYLNEQSKATLLEQKTLKFDIDKPTVSHQ